MQVILTKSQEQIDITPIVTSVTIRGDYHSCCREFSFGILQNQKSKNIPVINIALGDLVTVYHNNTTLFSGFVWSKSKQADSNTIDFIAKDRGIYLNKNEDFYNFKNIYPQDVAKKICSDYGIETGILTQVNKPINRIFMGDTLYKIIISSYNLANTGDKYMIIFTGSKLNVIKKGTVYAGSLESGSNLITASVSASLDSMVNTVQVYGNNNNLISTYKNDEDIKNLGSLTRIVRASAKDKDYKSIANKTLQRVEQKIRVQNFGDVNFTTGKYVIVTEPTTGLKGKFYIESDEHNFKNGIYTNNLVLNFENLADESEGGSNK